MNLLLRAATSLVPSIPVQHLHLYSAKDGKKKWNTGLFAQNLLEENIKEEGTRTCDLIHSTSPFHSIPSTCTSPWFSRTVVPFAHTDEHVPAVPGAADPLFQYGRRTCNSSFTPRDLLPSSAGAQLPLLAHAAKRKEDFPNKTPAFSHLGFGQWNQVKNRAVYTNHSIIHTKGQQQPTRNGITEPAAAVQPPSNYSKIIANLAIICSKSSCSQISTSWLTPEMS